MGKNFLARSTFAENEDARVFMLRNAVDSLLQHRNLAALAQKFAPAVAVVVFNGGFDVRLPRARLHSVGEITGRRCIE